MGGGVLQLMIERQDRWFIDELERWIISKRMLIVDELRDLILNLGSIWLRTGSWYWPTYRVNSLWEPSNWKAHCLEFQLGHLVEHRLTFKVKLNPISTISTLSLISNLHTVLYPNMKKLKSDQNGKLEIGISNTQKKSCLSFHHVYQSRTKCTDHCSRDQGLATGA